MLPAAISGIIASLEAISSTCASRLRPRPPAPPCRGTAPTAARSASGFDHRPVPSAPAFVPSTIAHSLPKATSRGRRTSPQSGLITSRSAGTTSSARRMRSATKAGDLDFVGLDVDDAEAELERHVEFFEQLQVVFAAARELQRHGAASWRRGSPGRETGSCPRTTACRSGCRSRRAASMWRSRRRPSR